MSKKKEAPDLRVYFMILLGLLALTFLLMWWFFPKKTVEVKTVYKTVYVKQDASITGATNVSISPTGAVSATGLNLSISTATLTKETEKSTDITKYETAQWFLMAYYGTDNRLGVGAMRRIIGPFYAGVGVDTELPILPLIDRYRGRVYLGASF